MSVLLPVRDAESTLLASLESLASQTLRDFEVVAVDDGSRDRSARILRDFALRDPRFSVIATRPQGIAPALNTGLAACRAPLVARMDADDVCEPERFEAQARFMARNPGIALCGTHVRVFSEGAPPGEGMARYARWLNSIVTPEDVAREIFVECPVAHPTFCFRRDAVADLGGYREGDFPEDYDLVFRLHEAGRPMANLPERLLGWRDHQTRATRIAPSYRRDAFLRLKALYLARTRLLGRRAIVWGAGGVGRFLSRELVRRGVDLAGFVDIDPEKWGRTVRDRPVHAPSLLDAGTDALVIGAVGTLGAREEIREALRARGFREGPDFVMAA